MFERGEVAEVRRVKNMHVIMLDQWAAVRAQSFQLRSAQADRDGALKVDAHRKTKGLYAVMVGDYHGNDRRAARPHQCGSGQDEAEQLEIARLKREVISLRRSGTS